MEEIQNKKLTLIPRQSWIVQVVTFNYEGIEVRSQIFSIIAEFFPKHFSFCFFVSDFDFFKIQSWLIFLQIIPTLDYSCLIQHRRIEI